MEYQEQEMDSLKLIIDKIFNINVMKNNRTRNIVDARLIYAKILRDRGHTYKSIGRSLNKDHTTILHYITQIDHLLKHDSRIAERYVICKEVFLKDKPHVSEKLTQTDLIAQLIKLSSDNESLILERKNVIEMKNNYKRIKKIMDIIESRTPKGDEKIVEERIIKMFNGLYQKE